MADLRWESDPLTAGGSLDDNERLLIDGQPVAYAYGGGFSGLYGWRVVENTAGVPLAISGNQAFGSVAPAKTECEEYVRAALAVLGGEEG